ncbi:Mitochondrial inner membrane protease atp23 [Microbotryomycetes sp. JL221]|nr:Mitochondrial inner membrane protease atp23 [Microbotryomycetes sp. JL221]
MTIEQDTPLFRRAFEQWRTTVSVLAFGNVLRCDSTSKAPQQTWEDGKIMQQAQQSGNGGSADPQNAEQDSATIASERKRLRRECKTCEKWRDELTTESPIIRFMLQHISLLPPPQNAPSTDDSPTPNLPLPIACKPCPPTLAGGYSSSLGILLCQNRFMSKKHMEDALAHELIHAWDERRFEVRGEWAKDLRAHACTEAEIDLIVDAMRGAAPQIRAENLSGDCRWGREFTRRNWSWTKQQQACVRRRAILSVAANPNCKSQEEAEKAVNEVWESCWNDTRPFDEIYA